MIYYSYHEILFRSNLQMALSFFQWKTNLDTGSKASIAALACMVLENVQSDLDETLLTIYNLQYK